MTASSNAGAKSVLQPVDRHCTLLIAVNADNVEATHMCTKLRIPGQKHRCHRRQFLLFSRIDSLRRADEASVVSVANLDKRQAAAVEHHEIDLAAACTKVLRDRTEPTLREKAKRHALGVGTYLDCPSPNQSSASLSSPAGSPLAGKNVSGAAVSGRATGTPR